LNNTPLTLEAENPLATYTYQWTNEVGDVLGNDATLKVIAAGKYTVTASDVSPIGCARERTIVVEDCATAGIDDQYLANISIYPNPTDNTLFITGNETPIAVSIYNVLGKEVLSIKNTNKINVQALPKGVYIIRISDGVGQTNRRFIMN
jgi:hypothetical protein